MFAFCFTTISLAFLYAVYNTPRFAILQGSNMPERTLDFFVVSESFSSCGLKIKRWSLP